MLAWVAMESRNCFTVKPSFISFTIHDSVFDSTTVRTNTTAENEAA